MIKPLFFATAVLALLASPSVAMHDGAQTQQLAAAGANANTTAIIGTGTVRSVDPARRTINLSHGAIPAINWPPMTMDFAVAPEVDLRTVTQGQTIAFTLVPAGGGNYAVSRITAKE